MGLSTERKVFVGILAVAGIALVLDRGVLGPSTAGASTEDLAVAPVPQDSGQPLSKPSSGHQTAAQILIDRLNNKHELTTPSEQPSLGAAFSLEQLIEPVMQTVNNQAPAATIPAEPRSRPALPVVTSRAVDLPTLTAVMPSSSGGGAVLNGKLVRIGQTDSAGFTLKQVRERGVVLEHDGQLYTIEIPMQTGS